MENDKAKMPSNSPWSGTEKESLRKERNRERQRRYREKALHDVDGLLLSRLQVMISAHANAALGRLVKATGKTRRELVEQALLEMQQRYSVTFE